MKYLFFFLISLIPFFLLGQQEYFNRRYDFNQSEFENGFGIIPYDSGYIAAFTTTDNSFATSLKLVICFSDSVGNIIQTKIYSDSIANIYIGGNSPITPTSDNGYAIATSYSYSETHANVVLYKFNHQGDTLWTKEYGDSLFQSGWQCKQTRDKGFIIAGQTTTYDSLGDILLIKTDSLGNLQWQNHYGGSGYDIAVSVDTCFDGGFVMCGGTESYGPHAYTTFPNGYIVKADSLGRFQWQQALGGIYDQAFWQIIQASDSSIFAGGYYSPYDPYQTCCGGDSKPWIVKLNLAGNVIWQKTYGDSLDETGLFTIKELPNGDIIGGGEANDPENYYAERGLVIKVNTNGDSLFYRKYAALSLHSDSYLYDISYDKDHGYICTGTLNPVTPDTGTQDIWVLKLDSNGCEVANCLSVTGINKLQQKNDDLINIYPNPTNSQATVEANVPANSISQELIITDILGQQLRTYQLLPGYNSIILVIDYLRPGMYFVHLISDGKILASNRLLKIN